MGKFFLIILLLLLTVAYFTKPNDKTCIIEGVRAVWGEKMPDANAYPEYFEQFMNVNSGSVEVKDRIFFKEILYQVKNGQKTVALGAFNTVFARVKPVEHKSYIPKPPQR